MDTVVCAGNQNWTWWPSTGGK